MGDSGHGDSDEKCPHRLYWLYLELSWGTWGSLGGVAFLEEAQYQG